MSLSRQLILIISFMFALVFAGTMAVSVGNMRSYLATQLESHAQDAATSLALSLQPHFVANDLPVMNTMVNAIFDGGYYQEITIVKSDGSTIIERINKVTIEEVPQWFVRLIHLETPRRKALISAGWKPGATIYIRSHPGYAYVELWEDTVGTFWWFLGALAVAVVFVTVVLRFVLRPLKEVERQALAISEREFPVLDRLPWTRELRSVVIAMNKMSKKVERIVIEQADLAQKLRKEAYVDQVTELANRRSFDIQLEHMVTARDEVAQGALVIIRISDFVEYNDRNGWAEGNKLLQQVADLLKERTENMRNATVARMGGAEFAVIAQHSTVEDAEELARLIEQGLNQFHIEGLEKGVAHIGIGYYNMDLSSSKLLAQADMALRSAQQKGPNAWHMYEAESLRKGEVIGSHQWQEIIKGVIEADSISFVYQPAKSIDGSKTLHYEVLARIRREDQSIIPAGVFMPMVERLGMTAEIDRMMINKLLATAKQTPGPGYVYSINLFVASALDPKFVDWLVEKLAASPAVAGRIIFEVSEYGALSDLVAFRKLIDRLR